MHTYTYIVTCVSIYTHIIGLRLGPWPVAFMQTWEPGSLHLGTIQHKYYRALNNYQCYSGGFPINYFV